MLTRDQILEHVWDYTFAGNASVLETYISYLRHKIDTVDPPLIHTVRGRRLQPPPPARARSPLRATAPAEPKAPPTSGAQYPGAGCQRSNSTPWSSRQRALPPEAYSVTSRTSPPSSRTRATMAGRSSTR